MALPDFRSYVLIRSKLNVSPSDIYCEMITAFPEDCPTQRTVYKWLDLIRSGSFSMKKGTSSGRLPTTSSPEEVQELEGIIQEHPRLSCRELSDIASLSKSTVHRILTTNLALRNALSMWVPHFKLMWDNARPHSQELRRNFCQNGR